MAEAWEYAEPEAWSLVEEEGVRGRQRGWEAKGATARGRERRGGGREQSAEEES